MTEPPEIQIQCNTMILKQNEILR